MNRLEKNHSQVLRSVWQRDTQTWRQSSKSRDNIEDPHVDPHVALEPLCSLRQFSRLDMVVTEDLIKAVSCYVGDSLGCCSSFYG